MGRMALLRGRVAAFMGGAEGTVALVPSTSAALATVAESVPEQVTQRRNRVVCSELDFPTLAYQWAAKPGVEMVILPSPDGVGMDPAQYEEAVDERTLFLATSHVFFTTGFIQDIACLAEIARKAGAFSVFDGYHGAGQISLDLSAAGVDFYTSGPLKWLCGGPGLSYLYVKPELIGSLHSRIPGWFGAKNAFDFEIRRMEPHDDARRFEMGTPALPTVHTALGGQEIVEEVGIERIEEQNHLTTAGDPSQRSAIVMIQHPDAPGAVLHLGNNGIIVDHRPGHIRVSPHFYNTEEEVGHFLDTLAGFAG
jgi:selenocysteine lyase/cysteine desulfurase